MISPDRHVAVCTAVLDATRMACWAIFWTGVQVRAKQRHCGGRRRGSAASGGSTEAGGRDGAWRRVGRRQGFPGADGRRGRPRTGQPGGAVAAGTPAGFPPARLSERPLLLAPWRPPYVSHVCQTQGVGRAGGCGGRWRCCLGLRLRGAPECAGILNKTVNSKL